MTQLSASLSAVADPTRRNIIAHLARGEATVSELVDQFDLTQPTISSHLKVLERAGLIVRTRVAQTRPCRLNPDGLKTISDWLRDYERFWQGTLDHFAEHAQQQTDPQQKGETDDR